VNHALQQEYEEVLPYHAFAVRVPQHAIYRLPQLLESLMKNTTKVGQGSGTVIVHFREALLLN